MHEISLRKGKSDTTDGQKAAGQPVLAIGIRLLKKIFRARNILLVLAVLIVGWLGEFAYRNNNICGPGERIIESDADVIKQAQIRIIRARYGSHGIPGYVDEKPAYADFSQTDCCKVTRTRTAFGVIVWEVSLDGETIGEPRKRHVGALMRLSNCGAVFDEESLIFSYPNR
jgi:hypothetical protein